MRIRRKRGWEIPEAELTSESAYWNRREFLRAAGFGLAATGLAGGLPGQALLGKDPEASPPAASKLYPAKLNPRYTLDRPLTPEKVATNYNNFYEFSYGKQGIARLAQKLETQPWKLEVTGLVRKPQTFDLDDLLKKVTLEERNYRFRCVEAWAMAVPWTGFPLKQLLSLVEPLGSAKFVRFVTFHRPDWAPNQKDTRYPWPYFEGLTLAEATNELTLMATGIFGKPMPNQNGAPVRLIVPWKYGFKSIKSIVKIEVTEEKPPTFWNVAVPLEYGFEANVNPAKPHPRWSQASERMIDTGDRRPTLPFNGYGEFVKKLYA